MDRVLLIFDDFTELTTMELNLKKVGFDVLGLSSEFTLAQQLLSFNPVLLIASGHSSRVNTVSIGKKLKENLRWTGKTILIFSPEGMPLPDDLPKMRIDLALEYPLSFTELLKEVSAVLGVQQEVLLERWRKMRAMDQDTGGEDEYNAGAVDADESIFATGTVDSDSLAKEISSLEQREIEKELSSKNWGKELADYENRKKATKPNMTALAKETGFKINKSLSKIEAKAELKANRVDWKQEELDDTDKARRSFTRALFKKSR